jgi:putative N-acetylmannosamine-6-phosphate epimerase
LIATTRQCVQAKLDPDFYMVTINRVNYYTSPPAETAELMKTIQKPWIGFKVLGAGRERPPAGFQHAFERGADFIAVGMFDWQVRDDVAHVQEMLAKGIDRERTWA